MQNLIKLIQKALAMEYAAQIQYNQHAEIIKGPHVEPVSNRVKDSSADETKHANTLCALLGDYLNAVPGVKVDDSIIPLTAAASLEQVIDANITAENAAIAQYKAVLAYLAEHSAEAEINPIYEHIEHAVRHILLEEQEHVAELRKLKI